MKKFPGKSWRVELSVIERIMNLAKAGATFAPRGVSFLCGFPVNTVQTHCVLLRQAGKLRQFRKDGERWYSDARQ